MQGKNYDKLIKWYQNLLKPRVDSLINIVIQKKIRDKEIEKEIKMFEKLLKQLDDSLKESKAEYFSGTDTVSAIDMVLHSGVSTIV